MYNVFMSSASKNARCDTYYCCFSVCSKLKRDSMLNELPDDDTATDLVLQQKEEEIRKMQDMLNHMQVF